MCYTFLVMARKDVFSLLQVDCCIQKAATFCLTPTGKKSILESRPFSEKALPDELRRLAEATSIIDVDGRFPLASGIDLKTAYAHCQKGACLEENELYGVAEEIEIASSMRRFLLSEQEKHPLLSEEASRLVEPTEIAKAIFDAIGPDLQVKDNATRKLASIRRDIINTKRDITSSLPGLLSRYSSYLTSMGFALKNGHYALPISASFKHLVRGIVQDISSSENTYFIEPEEILQRNAKLNELFADEREEVRHILDDLSSRVRGSAAELLNNTFILGDFDYLQAKVLYGQTYDGHIGNLSEDGSLFLPKAFHPMLEVKEVIKNDFSFSDKKRIVILSGPNAGGKTVALKTLGLCALFFEMAFLLPTAIGAELPYFKRVYAEMGDNSSLEDNLSTFSAHVSALKEITDHVGGKDLVLLDELGTGTSPLEGESLAKAMLDYLLQKHAYVFLSSHFEGVKEVGLTKPGVMSASMIFDKENLLPTYHLQIGLPGDSYGLEVAYRYGLKQEIIDSAKRYAESKRDKSLSGALTELNRLTAENRSLKEALEKKEKELENREKALKSRQKALEMKEERLMSDVERKKEKILSEAKAKVDDILHGVSGENVKPHKAAEAKKRLEAMEERNVAKSYNQELQVGDYVEVPSMGIEGRIKSISGNKAEIIASNGFPFKLEKAILKRKEEPAPEPKKEVTYTLGSIDSLGKDSLSLELNIIGLYADEARVQLEKYLDRCRMKGFHRVRIIHGFGTGSLRKMVVDYCKLRSDFIERCESAGASEGGGGATIVYLK